MRLRTGSARTVRSPGRPVILRTRLLVARRGTLGYHTVSHPPGWFLRRGRRVRRRSVGDPALDPGGHTETARDRLAQGIGVPGVLSKLDVDRELVGEGELEHRPVETLHARLLVYRRRGGLVPVSEILHQSDPLRRKIQPLTPLDLLVFWFPLSCLQNFSGVAVLRRSLYGRSLLGRCLRRPPRCVSLLDHKLESLKAAHKDRNGWLGVVAGQLQKRKLQLEFGIPGALYAAQSIAQSLYEPHDLGGRYASRLFFEGPPLLGADLGEGDLRGVRQEHQIAEVREKLADELSEVFTFVGEEIHDAQSVRSASLVQRDDRLLERSGAGAPEKLAHHRRRDGSLGERGELIQQALGISEGATSLASYYGQGFRFGLDPLGRRDLGELLPEHLDAGTSEIEGLAPADYSRQHLVLLGGGQDEDDVFGGLLEHLEEGIESLGGQHVDLVYDVDLHPAGDGREVHPISEVPDLVYPPVGGSVHLDHVERRVVDDRTAALARPVRLGRGASFAIQPHRQDLRRARLPRPPWPGEEVSVGDATGLYRAA